MHGKNANGEGSVYQTKNGRWVAAWSETGRKYPRQATGKSRDEAIRKRADRMGQPPPGAGLTLGELAEWWLHNVDKLRVSIDTWHKAEERLPRIKKALGGHLVTDLTYEVLVEWQAGLLERSAAGTVRNHRQTMALILDEAVRRGLMQGNPMRTIDPPTRNDADRPALESGQLHALVKAARELRLGAAVVLLFLQAWRVSEVLGLAWDDIDFKPARCRSPHLGLPEGRRPDAQAAGQDGRRSR